MRQEQSLNQILALSLHSFLSSDSQCKSSRAHSWNSLFMRMPAPALLWVRMTPTVWILACTTAGPFSGRRLHGRCHTFPCWPLMRHHIHPAKGSSENGCLVFMMPVTQVCLCYTGSLVQHRARQSVHRACNTGHIGCYVSPMMPCETDGLDLFKLKQMCIRTMPADCGWHHFPAGMSLHPASRTNDLSKPILQLRNSRQTVR